MWTYQFAWYSCNSATGDCDSPRARVNRRHRNTPLLKMPTDSECECDLVSKEWLLSKLRSDERDTVLIDCRGSNEYSVSHIRSAVNFSIPSIMLRRLAAGKIELASTVQCKELKARIQHCRTRGIFVLYGDGAPRDPDSVHGILLKRLKQDGVQVVCLEGMNHC